MKLLVIRSTQAFSGAETYTANLFGELKKQTGWDICGLTNLPALARELTKEKIHAVNCPWLPVEVGTKKQLFAMMLYVPIFIHKYISIIKKLENGTRFNIICLESRTEMVFLTPWLRLLGYKVVWIQHGPLFISETSRLIKTFYVFASRWVSKIIAVSKDTKNDLIAGGVDGSRIEVIYIGVNSNGKTGVKKTHTFTVGFLGTLTKEKGTDDFLEIAEKLKSKDIRFIIIGDGPERQNMMRRIKASFTGRVSNVKKYLDQVNAFLLPTHHHEGISMAILEAQAMGIPVLTTDIGGNREIIADGYNGYLYTLGDIVAMVKGVQSLIKNKKLLESMRSHAKQRVRERFKLSMQVKKFAKFFESV